MKRYWIDTVNGNYSPTFRRIDRNRWNFYSYEVDEQGKKITSTEECIATGHWKELEDYESTTPAEQEEIWADMERQIEEQLGFLPEYDIN